MVSLREKGNPGALFLGMYIGAVTMENSMEILQKLNNKKTIWSNFSNLCIYQKIQKCSFEKICVC